MVADGRWTLDGAFHEVKPIAVVLGTAECWHEDFAKFRERHSGPFDVFAVNAAVWLYDDPINYAVTLHPEEMPAHLERRVGNIPQLWTSLSKQSKVDDSWSVVGHWGPGSSGLFAVTVALHLGYTRVLLCGVPMDPRPHAEGASPKWEGGPWKDHEIHREGWTHHQDKLGCVRSMSGWTQALLGGPDAEFLYDRTETHTTMAARTVRPAMLNGEVTEAYWHCPSCGDTAIHRTTRSGRAYHCTTCGRDFEMHIHPVPWWSFNADELKVIYPPNLTEP